MNAKVDQIAGEQAANEGGDGTADDGGGQA